MARLRRILVVVDDQYAQRVDAGMVAAAMHFSQPTHQREPDAETALIASSAALAERENLEQLRKLLRRNPVAVATRSDLDLPALVRRCVA